MAQDTKSKLAKVYQKLSEGYAELAGIISAGLPADKSAGSESVSQPAERKPDTSAGSETNNKQSGASNSNGSKSAKSAKATSGADGGTRNGKPINRERMNTIYELAKANRIWANDLAKQMFGGRVVKELSDYEASRLLEEIQKRIANGNK